jgi:hypothetical protein
LDQFVGVECVPAIQPVCVISGSATLNTIVTPSITVPGFAADTCASVAPGCRACVHCCKQAFGDDMAAVELCKASFCNTRRIISTRCALRTTLCTAAAAARGGLRRAVPHAPPPDQSGACSTGEVCPVATTCATAM